MAEFSERKFWLGSLFVSPEYRSKGVATMLEKEVVRIAKLHSIPKLYLQTEALDGGLYTRLGWKGIEKFSYLEIKVLIMEKYL